MTTPSPTSSSPSFTTALVSLSVHDSLTFDGVEVALNPDLFSSYISKNNSKSSANNGSVVIFPNNQQPSTSNAATQGSSTFLGGASTGATHSRTPSRDSLGASSTFTNGGYNTTTTTSSGQGMGVGGHFQNHHHNRDSSFSNVTYASLTPTSSNGILPGTSHRRDTSEFSIESLKHTSGLQPGDMIEIRVWEEKKNTQEGVRTTRKGPYHNVSSSKSTQQQQQHVKTVIDRAASKLQQHINQSSSSIVHPLASNVTATDQPSTVKKFATNGTTATTTTTTTTSTSSKPPMVPRTTSNASSVVASPMHTGPTPSLSPSPVHQQSSSAPRLQLLPRRNSESKESSICRDDVTVSSNGNTDAESTSNTVIEGDKLNFPFPVPVLSTDKIAPPNNSGTVTPNLNVPMALSQSFDNDDLLDDGQEGTTPHSSEVPPQQTLSEDQQGQHEKMIDRISQTHVLKTKFVMGVTEKSLKAIKASARTQISLLKKVATLYNVATYDIVTITKIGKSEESSILESVRADYVTLTIKDQFISRGEMHQFQEYFQGKWIYSGERLKTKDDMRGYVMNIRNKDQELKSGFLTEETKITFRSRSARIFWLVQISSEMWDYASPYVEQGNGDGTCEIYFDKFTTFMKRLFSEWKALEVTHSLTIVFFSRTYIKSKNSACSETRSMMTSTNPEKLSMKRDTDGRLYEDFYKTIAENISKTTNWDSIITDVKKAFVSYPSEVGWKISSDNSYSRVPSNATQGNILEAINVALNVMQLHYIDRDLYRTGNSVVVVSGGSGVFQVDKNLAAITKQRMMDNGIGSDMISLGLPPLHVAPFFLYKETADASNDFDGWKAYFEIPHWMHLSFASYDRNKSKTNRSNSGPQPSMQIMSNGFVVHRHGKNENEQKRQQPQHLISDRDFEDILDACRPRNLEASKVGLPKALVAQMKIFGLMGRVDSDECHVNPNWGSLDFDAATNDSRNEDDERSKSSHSTNSLFTSTYAMALNHSPKSLAVSSQSPGSPVQIQQSRSLEIPLHMNNLIKLRNATREYDQKVFKPKPENNDSIHSTSRQNAEKEGIASSSPVRQQNPGGGIGAALHQYENKSDPSQVGDLQNPNSQANPNTPQNQSFMPREATKVTLMKRAFVGPKIGNTSLSPHLRANSLTYLHERPNEKAAANRLDVTQHTVTYLSSSTKPLEVPKSLSRSTHSDDIEINGRKSVNKNKVTHLSVSPKHFLTNHSGSPSGRVGIIKPMVGSQGNQAFMNDQNNRSQETAYPVPTQYSRKKKWVMNPFRQEDEDEVLLQKNHHSRRWSHVFPQGEIEFKRQSGPNWRSLCQPAILPIQIDVLPSEEELNSSKYKTTNYTLQFDKSHKDILKEMLRQRLTQDYQQVPQAVISESSRISIDNAEKLRKTYSSSKSLSSDSSRGIRENSSFLTINRDNTEKFLRNAYTSSNSPSSDLSRGSRENKSFVAKRDYQSPIIALSMGHRIQTMTLIPNAVKIKIFTRRDASNSMKDNRFNYNFKLWLPASRQYITVNQTFDKYQEEYKWNPLDLLISGDPNMYLTENSRNRCVSFRIIPDIFENKEQETSYMNKMLVLIEYLERLAQKKLGIELVSSSSNGVGKRNRRFKVNLRKSKRDKYEWMEVDVDSTVSTKRSFGITFHWLVATSMKIDSQVKALQRKCPKLNLVFAAFSASHSNFYMHPFVRPECFKVPNSMTARIVKDALLNRFDFCDDGIIEVFPEHTFGVKCRKINSGNRWERWATTTRYKAQQYVNRAATLFIRLLVDMDDSVLFVCLENRRHIGSDSNLLIAARTLLQQIKDFAHSIHTNN